MRVSEWVPFRFANFAIHFFFSLCTDETARSVAMQCIATTVLVSSDAVVSHGEHLVKTFGHRQFYTAAIARHSYVTLKYLIVPGNPIRVLVRHNPITDINFAALFFFSFLFLLRRSSSTMT